jgi:mycothiol system anti-sigma-R factor
MAKPEPPAHEHEHEHEHQTMDCTEALVRVFEYLDGEMGPADHAKIAAHLAECGRCLTQYNIDTALKALIRRSCAREPAPVQLRTTIIARLTIQFEQGPDFRH